MARPEKVAEVEAIAQRIQSAQSMVLADFTGLSVLQMTEFRRTCRAKSVECRVVKNRLAIIAADNADMAIMKDHLTGPTAIMFGPESQVDPAKIVVEPAQANSDYNNTLFMLQSTGGSTSAPGVPATYINQTQPTNPAYTGIQEVIITGDISKVTSFVMSLMVKSPTSL